MVDIELKSDHIHDMVPHWRHNYKVCAYCGKTRDQILKTLGDKS